MIEIRYARDAGKWARFVCWLNGHAYVWRAEFKPAANWICARCTRIGKDDDPNLQYPGYPT